jgi:hypothetical protein
VQIKILIVLLVLLCSLSHILIELHPRQGCWLRVCPTLPNDAQHRRHLLALIVDCQKNSYPLHREDMTNQIWTNQIAAFQPHSSPKKSDFSIFYSTLFYMVQTAPIRTNPRSFLFSELIYSSDLTG